MPTILIIDDDPTIRMLVRLTFEPHGYQVLEAEEGVSGLELAAENRADLFLLDMALPQMSGLDVARKLESSTPVLLLTGLAPDVDFEPDLTNVRGFVEKPFSPAVLVSRVQEILESDLVFPHTEAPAA